MSNLIKYFDIRLSVEDVEFESLKSYLKGQCVEWCFQKEKGETTEYLHYQCRVKTYEKVRDTTLANHIRTKLEYTGSLYVAPTSDACKGNYRYVTKDHTRVDGPWTHEDIEVPQRFNLPMWPFQKKVEDSFAEYDLDTRTVNCIIDTEGKSGKSTIGGRMHVLRIAHFIRDDLDTQKMVGEAYRQWNNDKSRGFIIDIKRANKDTVNYRSMFAAIETMKDGILQDWRFGDRPDKVTPFKPVIWVFMNHAPALDVLTPDRWKFYKINKDTKDFE